MSYLFLIHTAPDGAKALCEGGVYAEVPPAGSDYAGNSWRAAHAEAKRLNATASAANAYSTSGGLDGVAIDSTVASSLDSWQLAACASQPIGLESLGNVRQAQRRLPVSESMESDLSDLAAGSEHALNLAAGFRVIANGESHGLAMAIAAGALLESNAALNRTAGNAARAEIQQTRDALRMCDVTFRNLNESRFLAARLVAEKLNEWHDMGHNPASLAAFLDAVLQLEVDASEEHRARRNAQARGEDLAAQLSACQDQRAKLESDLAAMTAERDSMRAESDRLMERVEALRGDVAAYRQQRDEEGARATRNAALADAVAPVMAELAGLTLGMLPPGAYGAALADAFTTARDAIGKLS